MKHTPTDTRRFDVRLACLAATAALSMAACAAGAGPGSIQPSRSADVITREEIQERAAFAPNAYEVVRRLRATWLRPPGVTSFRQGTVIPVYLNNIRVGTVEYLEAVPVDRIGELRHFSATEATSRWGTGHTGGAIEVLTGELGVRRTGTPGEEEETDAPAYVPFVPSTAFFVNGGASKLTKPLEVAEVWEPELAVGGGVGINAAPTVTLLAAVEYHRFAFSSASALDYLMSRRLSGLRDPSGVELRGDGSAIFNVSAALKVHPRQGLIRPYLIGGVGYARFTAGAFTLSGPGGEPLPPTQYAAGTASGGDQRENSFSIAGGVGMDVRLAAHLRLFLDGRYTTAIRGPRYKDVFGKFQLNNTEFYPLRLGLLYQ